MFVDKSNLKPGMILAADLILSDNENNDVLLVEGQVLNQFYINKISLYDFDGAYIKGKAFSDLILEPELDKELETKALSEIKNFYTSLDYNNGKVTSESISIFSEIVEELVSDLLYKKELTNNIMIFRNHDEYTYQHCLSVANLSISTGISLGLKTEMLHDLGMAGFLHDIGKTVISKDIINKTGKLTENEYKIMKTHPFVAINMLKGLVSKEILEGIVSHHEKFDGTGYPYGKKGKNISLYGRILSICDVYHALTSNRSYRKPCFPPEVMEYLMGNAEKHFDYEILTVFLKNVVAFPVGTFIKLSNNKTGVVIKNNIENNLRPIIRLLNPDNTTGEVIDLFKNQHYMNVTIIA